MAHERFPTGLEVETKTSETDVVTRADRDAQRRVREVIRDSFPDDPIVAEKDEGRSATPESGPVWFVNTIDGTNNYVRGIPVWGTAVAAVVDGNPVISAIAVPGLEDSYRVGPDGAALDGDDLSVSERDDPGVCVASPTLAWCRFAADPQARICRAIGERFADLRRFRCTQATLAFVASGALDGAILNLRAHPWDIVAGVHAIREAGGTVTDLEGDYWRHDSRGLVASNGVVHGEILAAAREIDDWKSAVSPILGRVLYRFDRS